MKVLELRQSSDNFDLVMTEHETPVISGNEVLVEIEYVALNHIDARLAKEGFSQWQYPHVLGMDAVGTVVSAPAGIFPTKGARVLFHANLAEQGMLKEYAAVPNHALCEIPDGLAPDVAVVLPNSGLTALLAIEKLRLQEGDTLAINSAQGAVAHFAIQYARQQGAKVFAFAPRPHHKRLLGLGADFAFDCEADNVCEQIKRELGPGGFDCILNTKGGASFLEDLTRLRFCGRIAALNGFGTIPEELLFEKAPNIGVVSVSGAWLSKSLCAQQHLCFLGDKLISDVLSGEILPPSREAIEFTASAVQNALKNLIDQRCEGRPVVRVKVK